MDFLQHLNRRAALKATLATGTAAAVAQFLADDAVAANSVDLAAGATILFQGDSITDAGRSRQNQSANNSGSFGSGYPLYISAKLLADHPQLKLTCYNRGISGNKVPDLQARWQTDCIDLKPNILSILIGVNDIWHKLNGRYDGTVESYEREYNELLSTTREALPDTQLVVCEPFVLRCGAVNDGWFPEFDERRAACKRVAEAHQTTFVPFQSMFDEAVAAGSDPAYWAGDGVHPSMAGHALMAKTWMNTVLG